MTAEPQRMIIDQLTIAGLLAVTPFALMPVLMGRELIRVSPCEDQPESRPAADTRQTVTDIPASAEGRVMLNEGCVSEA